VRLEILSSESEAGVGVIDLATHLRHAARGGSQRLFHPNEGHLSAAGHHEVASALRSALEPLARKPPLP
jgi:hypothetical protein